MLRALVGDNRAAERQLPRQVAPVKPLAEPRLEPLVTPLRRRRAAVAACSLARPPAGHPWPPDSRCSRASLFSAVERAGGRNQRGDTSQSAAVDASLRPNSSRCRSTRAHIHRGSPGESCLVQRCGSDRRQTVTETTVSMAVLDWAELQSLAVSDSHAFVFRLPLSVHTLLNVLGLTAAVSCTIASGNSRRTNPPQPVPNQPPAPYGPPAPPPAQYNPPAGSTGLCAALRRRQYACPSENSPGGCEHEERCLTGLSRPDAMAMLSDCVQHGPCNVAPGIFEYCVDITRQRLRPTPVTSQLAALCSAAAPTCPGKVAEKCASAHLLSDAVAAQVSQCLAIPDCHTKDQCVERVYDSRGCP